MAQATNTITIKVDGATLDAKAVKVKFGLPTREAQLSAGVMGRHFTVKPEPSQVTCTILHLGDFSLDKVAAWENVTLVCESDNGLVYQIDGAYVTNSPELSDEGGGVNVEFMGPPAKAV